MSDCPPAPCAALDGTAAFDHWLRTCGQNPWEPLSADAAQPYRFIWLSWLRYLASATDAAQGDWQTAHALQVLGFINHAPQSHKNHKPSDITRRRYWRVLDRVYDHAVLHGWVSHNPAQGITYEDLPPSEDPQGAILSPRMWHALTAALPAPEDLISCRDRAILVLLMELGITPEEVRLLELDNLQWSATPNTSGAAARSATISAIQIVGERDRQSRTLPVSAALNTALQHWLQARAGYHAMQGQTALFCTRKAPQLSKHTLLHLVTKTLQQAAHHSGLAQPPRMGPQVIRNTVLVQWLDAGCSVEEVLARSGMKHPNALLHLRAYFGD